MATLAFILQILLLISGLLLMMIILLQRGRGGGLAGAFGGAGGQSAFGTKAGDVFTWITVSVAVIWVLLAGIGGCAMRKAATSFGDTLPTGEATMSSGEDADETADDSEATTPADDSKVAPLGGPGLIEEKTKTEEAPVTPAEPESTEEPEAKKSETEKADIEEPMAEESETEKPAAEKPETKKTETEKPAEES